MSDAGESRSYSAPVHLILRVGDRSLRLAQVAPSWFQVDKPVALPTGPATLEIVIDGRCTPTMIEVEGREEPSRRFHYDLAS